MKTRVASSSPDRYRRRFGQWVGISLLLVLSQSGCGREFYREWANQDVTEAIYEKSRDPRYRLDVFSIEPPAMARFADPYDPDRPPAPPDDFAAQATSPQPQWPDHRLIMPPEGTGYLTILGEGPTYQPPPKKPRQTVPATPDVVKPATPVPPPPPINPSPFQPGINNPNNPALPGPGASRTNSGTGSPAMSPTSVVAKTTPSNARPATAATGDGVRRTSMQDPADVMLTQIPPPQQIPRNQATSPTDPMRTPRNPQDPRPVDEDLSKPGAPLPGMNVDQAQQAEEIQNRLAKMFIPEDIPFDEAIAAGLQENSRPYVLSMEKAFQLAILNSRYYQYELENVYITALPVALQRFSFTPQFIAGLTPSTGIAGAGSTAPAGGGTLPAQGVVNSFTYTTRGTGSQTSSLNYGTVVGVGKLFDNGAKVLASFANQLVFNFVGKNPMQPTVKSYIPIQAIVPFLRGGGRAVTLEPLTTAERNLLYAIRAFALFRQQFTVATLTGGTEQTFGVSTTTQGFSTGGNIDPVIGFLNVVEDVAIVENYVKNLSVFERFLIVYKELINGETSGLSQLQVDQVNQQVQQARISLIASQNTYRNDLDQFKIQLGMPPDVPIIIGRSRTKGFKDVFERIDKWSLSAKRERRELEAIVDSVPKLEDIVIDGRSAQTVFRSTDINGPPLEDLLLSAERVALENRLDLMNARAQLYDTWRQIRVTANALKGILNVAVTNQYLTPPTTNNPFGFVNQAKSFSLVLNAELPLVRVNERNNFRTALINYQRQRRVLQNTEDFLKFQLRQEVRFMQFYYTQYQATKRALLLAVTVKDQAYEQIVAPPQPNVATQAPTNTLNLIQAQQTIIQSENNLVTFWYQYQLYRLQVYRDLGILPIDEWEAFDEIFPPDREARDTTRTAAAITPEGRTASASPAGSAESVGPR